MASLTLITLSLSGDAERPTEPRSGKRKKKNLFYMYWKYKIFYSRILKYFYLLLRCLRFDIVFFGSAQKIVFGSVVLDKIGEVQNKTFWPTWQAIHF